MPPAISTHALTRDFKKTRAVDTLTLDIAAGELFGLVGPDGAGKTTTLRLLAGLLRITEGEAEVAGLNLKTDAEAVKRRVGYMAQQFSLYAELSVEENLAFFAEVYDVPRGEREERAARLLEFAQLEEFRTRRADKLSGGMQKKLALACTLIHEPEILLLDEPTTGVDPVSRREFWNILADLHLSGTTILVSTPYMDEADRCSRVGLMYEGRLVACASPRELRESLGAEVALAATPDALEKAGAVVLPGVGNFGDGMRRLDEMELAEPVKKLVENGKPFMGICLGMQLLMETSEEAPGVPGLGVFKGAVKRFED